MVITFGDPVMPEEIKQFGEDITGLGEYLKAQTYALK